MTNTKPFISYAQNQEDVMLYRAFKNIDQGFYIDVGAQHPEIESVTKLFYDRGWKGINIEPSSHYFDLLVKDRKRDINLNLLASNVTSEDVMFYEIENSGLSTMVEKIAQTHKDQGWEIKETKIPSKTLDQICEEHCTDEIHFLKIDVEGAEDQVLEGFSFKTRPWIILIESTKPLSDEDVSSKWSQQFETANYQQVWFDGINRFYISNDKLELSQYFSCPPNLHDKFVSSDYFRINTDYQKLYTQFHELNEKHHELNKEYFEKHSELNEKFNELSKRHHQVLFDIVHIRQINSELKQKNLVFERYINDLKQSKYWKITSPLRDLGKLKLKTQSLLRKQT